MACLTHPSSPNARQITLTFCLYELATHPDVERKVLDEFDRVLGPNPPTLSTVRECRYTKQVIQETLRMYPPVPIDGYEAQTDDVLPGGFPIPKGQCVRLSLRCGFGGKQL